MRMPHRSRMLLLYLTAVAGSTLRLTDAASKRPVVLVGTMHYNPHSADAVEGAVRDAAARLRRLGR